MISCAASFMYHTFRIMIMRSFMFKKMIALSCIAVAFCAYASFTENIDGIEWHYKVSNGEACIENKPLFAAIPRSVSGKIRIPSELGGYPVTVIGDSAFFERRQISGVTFPDSIVNIGFRAFERCESLQEAVIPDGVKEIGESAFRFCTSLKRVVIPNSVTNIGKTAFHKCESLQEIVIPDGVKEIGKSAFESCTSLKRVVIPSSVTNIGQNAFGGCDSIRQVVLPSWLVTDRNRLRQVLGEAVINSITHFAFSDRIDTLSRVPFPALTHYEIPDGVQSIDRNAFADRQLLEEIVIPNSVTRIEQNAFGHCKSLRSVSLPQCLSTNRAALYNVFGMPGVTSITHLAFSDGVHTIGENAIEKPQFYSVESIEIPSSVQKIEFQPFRECRSIISMTIPQYVCEGRDMGDYFGLDRTTGKNHSKDIKEIKVLDGVTHIGANVFQECDALQRIVLPDSVYSIDNGAFDNCRSILDVTIPQYVLDVGVASVFGTSYQSISNVVLSTGVRHIAMEAFKNCASLHRIKIPNGIEAIPERAFEGCVSLEYVNLPNGIRMLEPHSFARCSALKNMSFPNGIEGIAPFAFEGCSALEKIDLPDSVRFIAEGAFAGCSSLKRAILREGLDGIDSMAFEDCISLKDISLPQSLRHIDPNAFRNCRSLTKIVIHPGVTDVGDGAFGGCTSLLDITIPQCVCDKGLPVIFPSSYQNFTEVKFIGDITNIGAGAFAGCCSLQRVMLPHGVQNIGERAFNGCSSLAGISIPDSISSIGNAAFDGCFNLESVVIPARFLPELEHIFPDSYRLLKHLTIWGSRNDEASNALSKFENLNSLTFVSEDDVLPEIANGVPLETIDAILRNSADTAKLSKNITTVSEYRDFRNWASGLANASLQKVNSSPNAWLSYALGSSKLIEKEPQPGDLTIGGFTSVKDEELSDELFSLEVSIKDIPVGNNASLSNLAKVFSVEGAETLDAYEFKPENVEVEFTKPQNGKAKIIVRPKREDEAHSENAPQSFFMRVKMQ